MKHVIILFAIIFALSSCGSNTEETETTQDVIETSVSLSEAQYKSASIELRKIREKRNL
jgi:uncharacterized protein YceK